ncbi:hypothetical protein McanMca71_005458 [Microsporum canis]
MHEPDSQTIAAFAKKGWCYAYVSTQNLNKTLAPCKTYCQTHNMGKLDDISCVLFGATSKELAAQGLSYTDDDGNEFVTGECDCDLEWLGKIIFTVLEGLERLDEIVCGVFVSAFELILDVGLSALPGGQIKQLGTLVRGAKTLVENGLDASAFFGGWVTPICGKDWDREAQHNVFNGFAEAPDEYGTSIGCKRAEGCIESRSFPEDRGGKGKRGKGGKPGKGKDDSKSKDEPKTNDKPKPSDDPKPTTKEEPKPTTDDKPKSTTKEPPKTTTKEKPKTTTERRTQSKTTEHKSTTTKGPVKSTSNSKPWSTTATNPHSTSEESHNLTTTNQAKSTSKKDGTKSTSTSHSKPTTTNHHMVSSTVSQSKSTSTKRSTQISSTKTQEPSATPPSCKPGKGINGCSECSNVRVWEPGSSEDEERGDDSAVEDEENNGSSDLAVRGSGFFNWVSQELDRRASKAGSRTKPKDKKEIKFCGLQAFTNPYPSGGNLAKKKNVGKDIIYSVAKPDECGDFSFARRPTSKFSTDYKKFSSPWDPDRGFATEHIVEAQLIHQFSEDISKSMGEIFLDPYSKSAKVDFCTYMNAYWNDTNKNPLPALSGVSKNPTRPATKWIADQYPVNTMWLDEFVLLTGGVNNVKSRMWNDGTLVDERYITDPLMGDDFLTMPLKGSKTINAILRFKDVIFAYKYHTEPEIERIFKLQIDRISTIFGNLDDETKHLDFEQNANALKKILRDYKPQELQKKWDKWIKEHTDKSIAKVEDFFNEHYHKYSDTRKRLQKGLQDAINAAEKEERENKKKTLNQQQKKAADAKREQHKAEKEKYETVIQYLKDLEATYLETMKTKWKNPLK